MTASHSTLPKDSPRVDPTSHAGSRGRAVVAMSGGVDSSVAAWMLQRQGFEVVGLFMRNGVHLAEGEAGKKSCCSVGDARDARMVAAGLGIPFQAVDLGQEFGAIIRYFLGEYARGRTDRKSTRLNSSHIQKSRMPSSA